MEFWGVEVKAGQSLPVCPDDGQLIHISQVALGEVKNMKSANYVPIRLTVDGKKFVIGTLSAERGPQITFDLVLEKEFELSHDWKDGSVYFCGYTADEQDDGPMGHEGYSDEDEDESSEEEMELENGKPVIGAPAAKPTNDKAAAAKPKQKVTLVEPKKDESDESDGSEDDESDDDDLEDDSDDMSEDEETPQKTPPKKVLKAEASKKRPSESEVKTPASNKKSKTETPQKTDGKKGSVHTATPHPSKKSEKKTADTPKSSGQVSCKTCSKTFSSEKGLESHSKAKHGGK